VVERCTFTGNRNGVDDMSGRGIYRDCVFFRNDVNRGQAGERYELDLANGGSVENCFIAGRIFDPRKVISSEKNSQNPPAPDFTADFSPQSPAYKRVGYRPVNRAVRQ
jgi:hypothetical protein